MLIPGVVILDETSFQGIKPQGLKYAIWPGNVPCYYLEASVIRLARFYLLVWSDKKLAVCFQGWY
jgi:hypothetical protein